MNEMEFNKWTDDATQALLRTGRYTADEITKILAWFWSMDSRAESDLIGDDALKALSMVLEQNFDMYNSLMVRLFVYSPLILKVSE